MRRLFNAPWSRPGRAREELEAEVRAHVEARVEYLVARGVQPGVARAEAERRFGGVDAAIDALEASAAERDRSLALRERWRLVAFDARFVLRGLRRSPAFTLGVVATFALGLGINSAVFRITDHALLRAPAGISAAGGLRRVHTLGAAGRSGEPPDETPRFSYPDVDALTRSGAFAQAAAYSSPRPLRLEDGREISAAYVDTAFFTTLGVRPAAGRLFGSDEAQVGANVAVAIVGYNLWQRDLGGVPLDGSQSLVVGGIRYRVVGAAPRGFTGLDPDPVDIWLPLGIAAFGRGVINGVEIPWYRTAGARAVQLVARVPRGVADPDVGGRAETALLRSAALGPFARRVVLRSIVFANSDPQADQTNRVIERLAAVAFLVLLISCANAANLMLARALRRRKEIAVRLSLGASRMLIVRLLVIESVILGLAGGVCATIAGVWTAEALRRLLLPDAHWISPALDNRALAFTLGAAAIAGLAAGFAPAFQLSAPDLLSALKDVRTRAGGRAHVTRTGLIVLQTAFSLVLLVASGLLVRSLQRLNAVAMGYAPDNLVTALLPSRTLGGRTLDPNAVVAANFVTAPELADRLRRNADVKAVALASTVPFGAHSMRSVSVPGRPAPDLPPMSGPYVIAVSANYFSVLGTRTLRGRTFSDNDTRSTEPVAVIGASMARLYWPDGDPSSSCLLIGSMGCARVVGVVEDVKDAPGSAPPLRYYLALAQYEDSAAAVIVRATAGRAPSVAAALKAAIPAEQRPQIEVLSNRVDQALRPWHTAALLFSMLGVVALVLVTVGVYSVMSYVASERVPEIGIRIVLGATAADVVRLLLTDGLRLVLIGAVLGLAAAATTARLLGSLLFGVSSLDPTVYVGAVAAVAVVGILATTVPAIRSLRTSPTEALRSE